MKFALLYRGGDAPEDKMQEYYEKWAKWTKMIQNEGIETFGIRVQGGKRLTAHGVKDYTSAGGDVLGISVIEAESMEKAIEIAKGCPSLSYGGTVEILDEFPQ